MPPVDPTTNWVAGGSDPDEQYYVDLLLEMMMENEVVTGFYNRPQADLDDVFDE